MKKFFFNSFLLSIAIVLSSCTGSKVKDLVAELQQAVASKDNARITSIYPDAENFTIKPFTIGDDGVEFKESEGKQDEYIATIGKDIELTISVLSGDKMQVKSSRGLLLIPEEDEALALATGWVDKELTDLENAERLKDARFKQYMNGIMAETLKNSMVVENVQIKQISRKVTSWFEPGEPMEWSYVVRITFDVVNKTSSTIGANAYNCIGEVIIAGMYDETSTEKIVVKTKPIPANGKTQLEFEYNGSEECVEGTGGVVEVKPILSFNFNKIDISEVYKATGKEYKDFIKDKGEFKSSGEVKGLLRGTIGNDKDATMELNGSDGSYKVLGMGRSLMVASYDSNSGDLALDAYIDGEKFGEFKGVWKEDNGICTYKGKFTNLKAHATLSFDLSSK